MVTQLTELVVAPRIHLSIKQSTIYKTIQIRVKYLSIAGQRQSVKSSATDFSNQLICQTINELWRLCGLESADPELSLLVVAPDIALTGGRQSDPVLETDHKIGDLFAGKSLIELWPLHLSVRPEAEAAEPIATKPINPVVVCGEYHFSGCTAEDTQESDLSAKVWLYL